MKKHNFILIGFVLFVSLFVGMSFSASPTSSVVSDVSSGPSLMNQHNGNSNSVVIQGSCTGTACPLPNLLTNGTI